MYCGFPDDDVTGNVTLTFTMQYLYRIAILSYVYWTVHHLDS